MLLFPCIDLLRLRVPFRCNAKSDMKAFFSQGYHIRRATWGAEATLWTHWHVF